MSRAPLSLTQTMVGDRATLKKLQELDGSQMQSCFQTTVRAGLRIITNSAKARASYKTGNLRRSLSDQITQVLRSRVEGVSGTNLEYAPAQEFGATITPKTAKWLTIPLTRQAERVAGARNFPGLHFIPIGPRRALLVDKRGVAQYALRKEVTIPARPFLRPALSENVDLINRRTAQVLRATLAKIAQSGAQSGA